MAFGDRDDRHPTIGGLVHVVRCDRQTAVTITGAFGQLTVREVVDPAEDRRERGIHRVVHCDLDDLPLAGAFALEERGGNSAKQVNPTKEVDERRACLNRRAVRKAGRGNSAAHCLHCDVHRGHVGVGPFVAVALAGGIDEPRIQLHQLLGIESESFHGSGSEVLDDDIDVLDQILEYLTTLIGFYIHDDAALVGVQHQELMRLDTVSGSISQPLTSGWLKLDDFRTEQSHQQATVWAVVYLSDLEDANSLKCGCHVVPFEVVWGVTFGAESSYK